MDGYQTVIDTQTQDIKKHTNSHLQDLMEDGETYGWPVVRDFYSTWLQHIDMGRATWDDHVTKMKLRWTLMWHRVAYPMQGLPPTPFKRGNSPPPPANTTQRILVSQQPMMM